ncbi:hypothetical protein CHCC14821_2105 [Bacillus paralicheniformis]|nr:hypothetical protein CHCC14821_2105 [Bacillus paralicheniformis]
MEFSRCHPDLENGACPHLWKHGRHQAGYGNCSHLPQGYLVL